MLRRTRPATRAVSAFQLFVKDLSQRNQFSSRLDSGNRNMRKASRLWKKMSPEEQLAFANRVRTSNKSISKKTLKSGVLALTEGQATTDEEQVAVRNKKLTDFNILLKRLYQPDLGLNVLPNEFVLKVASQTMSDLSATEDYEARMQEMRQAVNAYEVEKKQAARAVFDEDLEDGDAHHHDMEAEDGVIILNNQKKAKKAPAIAVAAPTANDVAVAAEQQSVNDNDGAPVAAMENADVTNPAQEFVNELLSKITQNSSNVAPSALSGGKQKTVKSHVTIFPKPFYELIVLTSDHHHYSEMAFGLVPSVKSQANDHCKPKKATVSTSTATTYHSAISNARDFLFGHTKRHVVQQIVAIAQETAPIYFNGRQWSTLSKAEFEHLCVSWAASALSFVQLLNRDGKNDDVITKSGGLNETATDLYLTEFFGNGLTPKQRIACNLFFIPRFVAPRDHDHLCNPALDAFDEFCGASAYVARDPPSLADAVSELKSGSQSIISGSDGVAIANVVAAFVGIDNSNQNRPLPIHSHPTVEVLPPSAVYTPSHDVHMTPESCEYWRYLLYLSTANSLKNPIARVQMLTNFEVFSEWHQKTGCSDISFITTCFRGKSMPLASIETYQMEHKMTPEEASELVAQIINNDTMPGSSIYDKALTLSSKYQSAEQSMYYKRREVFLAGSGGRPRAAFSGVVDMTLRQSVEKKASASSAAAVREKEEVASSGETTNDGEIPAVAAPVVVKDKVKEFFTIDAPAFEASQRGACSRLVDNFLLENFAIFAASSKRTMSAVVKADTKMFLMKRGDGNVKQPDLLKRGFGRPSTGPLATVAPGVLPSSAPAAAARKAAATLQRKAKVGAMKKKKSSPSKGRVVGGKKIKKIFKKKKKASASPARKKPVVAKKKKLLKKKGIVKKSKKVMLKKKGGKKAKKGGKKK